MNRSGTNRQFARGSFIVDRRGTILGFDEGLEAITGWQAVEAVGRTHLRTTETGPPVDRPAGSICLYQGEIPTVDTTRSIDLTLHTRDRRRLKVEAVATRLPGPGDRIQVSILRVLSRSAERAMSPIGDRRDPLTGLLDRDAFEDCISADLHDAVENARPLSLILVDVDHLRHVNDRLGEEAGDEVLQHLAGILRVSIEDETRIFRLGDDDFAILMPDAGRGEARQVAAGLRSIVERYRLFPKGPGGVDPRITLSLGAASVPTDADSSADLYERAEDALNEARSMGRNRVWCYLRRPRVPLQVPVFFDGTEELLVGYTRDLSPSGFFVQTSAPVDVGMRCALTFTLPGREGSVHVIGRVVRTVPPETTYDAVDLRIPGMGVEFERFGGSNDRRAIDSFLHGLEATTLRPETGRLSLGKTES
jgi:uncharacterized protein (TIGR02266 family)